MAGKSISVVLCCGLALVVVSHPPLSAQTVATSDAPVTKPSSFGLVSLDVTRAPLLGVLKTIARQAGLNPAYGAAVTGNSARVTVRLHNTDVREAFAVVLRQTGLMAKIDGDVVSFLPDDRSGPIAVAQGRVHGTILDAKTKRPIRGATITLSGVSGQSLTDDNGAFRFATVAPGTYTVSARALGYVKESKSVTVLDGQTVMVEMALTPSVNALDQVVITGTVVPTELKAIPNAMTVITAKQIEERGITKIDQLFRGDVPGLFVQNRGSAVKLDEVRMYSRGTTSLVQQDPMTGEEIAFTNPIKTYVDGVEMADPKYLSQIDPKSIERIEILAGPQASTIYGSNAINGVMQIFTKRGSAPRPQLTLNLLSGWVENDFRQTRTPQHDYSAQVNGIENRLSYNAGGSWNYMGPWTPAKQTTRLNGFGGTRLDIPTPAGRITTDVTLRRDMTQNRQQGAAEQRSTGYRESGWYNGYAASGLGAPTTLTLMGQTIGVVLGYALTNWWSHELGVGSDISDMEERQTARAYRASTSDTALLFRQTHADRRSLRYSTTARIPLSSLAQATITAGGDAWQRLTSVWSVRPQSLTGTLTGTTSVKRQPTHNAGGFLQTQLGVHDALFFTYGLRMEWNPDYGEDAQPNLAPRYGVAYTRDLGTPLGMMTVKLRGSYGRSTRPPAPTQKAQRTAIDAYGANWATYSPYYDNFDVIVANPDLGPETQQGGEGGMELYFGTRGSLVINRYNQTVDGLISRVRADTARSFTACVPNCPFSYGDNDNYGYFYGNQYVNVASIRNRGWELQGNMNVGPLTTRGTYSWTKSRTIGVNQTYRAYFASDPQYQSGAGFNYLPEHTWAFEVAYTQSATVVRLNLTGTGRIAIYNANDFFMRYLNANIRLQQNRLRMSTSYVNDIRGYALADLSASRRFSPSVEGVLQIQNLSDHYQNEYYADYATLGRQTKLGLRVRL